MAECSQMFKEMLTAFYAEAYEDGTCQCELSSPTQEKEAAILQYVAELEAAYTAPAPAHAVPDADGARFRWLCEDHSDRETRERCRSLIDRLPVMSYSDAVMSVDEAMAAAPEYKEPSLLDMTGGMP